MKTTKSRWYNAFIGVLLFGLASLVLVVLVVVNSLEEQIYTEGQQEFLDYARGRAITQAPVTTNFLSYASGAPGVVVAGADAETQPANFSVWENHVQATLKARYEEQEGVSVTLYDLDFESEYHLQHSPTGLTSTLELIFPFPANLETLNDVHFEVDGEEPLDVQYTPQQIRWLTTLNPGAEHDIRIRYRADGASSFSYGLSQNRRTNQLDVVIVIEGLAGSEVPQHSLPTTAVAPLSSPGETFTWRYDNLVANRDIYLTLPQQLSFAQRVASLQDDFIILGTMAPLLMLLFLGTVIIVFRSEGQGLELPGYLLMGFGFLLFYPLLTFLSGFVGGFAAALVAFVVIGVLLVGFSWLMTGRRTMMWWTGWLLFIFLGVISLGILLPFRSLLWVAGGVMLVGTLMRVYAKRPSSMAPSIESETVPPAAPAEEDARAAEKMPEPSHEPLAVVEPISPSPAAHIHCPQCGREQADDYAFCPGCGYDGRFLRQCTRCGHGQVVSGNMTVVYCVHCGQSL